MARRDRRLWGHECPVGVHVPIEQGTADQLKRKVGHERLEVCVAHPDGLRAAVHALSAVAVADPVVDERRRSITIELRDPADGLVMAASALRNSGVAYSDFALRLPTLDEVFLDLTGRP